MSSIKVNEDYAKSLHQNAQRIADFVQMTSSHNFLASSVAGSSESLNIYGCELRNNLLNLENTIVKEAFAIMKALLPAIRRLNSSNGSPNDAELQKSLELQWIDFTLCLEMFGTDVKTLWFLNDAFAKPGSMLDWPGVKTGFHSMPSNCAIPSDVDDDVNKPASSKMEDAIRKTEMILQSLKTQMAVQAWAVEHFSSFAIGSVAAAEGKGFRIKIDLSKLMSEKPKILIAIVAIVLVIIGLVVASTFLF